MNREFIKNYQRNLLLSHVLVEAAIFLGTLTSYLLIDFVFIGSADRLAGYIGVGVTHWLMYNKTYVLFFSVLFVSVIGWIVVEMRAVRKLADVISQIGILFKEDDSLMSIGKEFSLIESQLNGLKLENMRNQRLAESEAQRKTDLITYLAHDIKTPLASIIGYLSLLDETPDLPLTQKQKYTSVTLEKAYRLEALIDEFFDITRFNLSSIPLEKENIKLKFMLEQMAEEFYPLLTHRGRSARVTMDDDIQVYADPDKLARVFNNILKNAISYSDENSVIDISAAQEKEFVHIRFANQGKEIPQHKLDSIFEKFFRLDAARSSHTGGAGLGLAIAKEIVVQHGGSIHVTSTDGETVFTVAVPVFVRHGLVAVPQLNY